MCTSTIRQDVFWQLWRGTHNFLASPNTTTAVSKLKSDDMAIFGSEYGKICF